MYRKLFLGLFLGLEVASACATKTGTENFLLPHAPFTLHILDTWEQPMWEERDDHTTATVYYQGRPLALPGVLADTLHPRFAWWLGLPGGRLLLGMRPRQNTRIDDAFTLYLLDAPGRQPRLHPLGRCAFYGSNPDLWLTADSLGALLGSPPTSAGKFTFPYFRFFDLQAPTTFLPLNGDTTRFGKALPYVSSIAWSPDPAHRLLALVSPYRFYDQHTDRAIVAVFDRRTGRRQPARRFTGVVDTVHALRESPPKSLR